MKKRNLYFKCHEMLFPILHKTLGFLLHVLFIKFVSPQSYTPLSLFYTHPSVTSKPVINSNRPLNLSLTLLIFGVVVHYQEPESFSFIVKE